MLALILLIIVLSTAMAWVIADSKGAGKIVKFLMITALIYVGFSLFYSFNNFKGWPTKSKMPSEVVVEDFIVIEPSKNSSDPGKIYVWAIPAERIDECPDLLICIDSWKKETPRAYEMEYDVKMHDVLLQIGEQLDGGGTVVLKKEKKGVLSSGEEEYKAYNLPDLQNHLSK